MMANSRKLAIEEEGPRYQANSLVPIKIISSKEVVEIYVNNKLVSY